jgi:hypothetical protein
MQRRHTVHTVTEHCMQWRGRALCDSVPCRYHKDDKDERLQQGLWCRLACYFRDDAGCLIAEPYTHSAHHARVRRVHEYSGECVHCVSRRDSEKNARMWWRLRAHCVSRGVLVLRMQWGCMHCVSRRIGRKSRSQSGSATHRVWTCWGPMGCEPSRSVRREEVTQPVRQRDP